MPKLVFFWIYRCIAAFSSVGIKKSRVLDFLRSLISVTALQTMFESIADAYSFNRQLYFDSCRCEWKRQNRLPISERTEMGKEEQVRPPFTFDFMKLRTPML